MTLNLIIFWIIIISSITLLGSLYVKKYNKPDLLIGIYVTFILLSQILAIKISNFVIWGHSYFAPSAVLIFSVTYLLTDIINEKFGVKETRRMIFIAFIAQIIFVLFLWFSVTIEPAPFWTLQEAWRSIFMVVPRIMAASWIAFFISENIDASIFHLVKKVTNDKHLWMRNAFSSIPSLLIDSLIFIPLAFWGTMPTVALFSLMFGQVILKWLVGLINIPFMYLNKYILTK